MKTNFIKKLIAMMGVLAFVAIGGMAHAGTFVLGDGTGTGATGGTVVTFANELFGEGSGSTVIPSGGIFEVVYTMAAAPGSGKGFNIVFTLNGAKWGANLDAKSESIISLATALAIQGLGYAPISADMDDVVSILKMDDGNKGDSSVKYRVDPPAGMATDDKFVFRFQIMGANPDSELSLSITLEDEIGNVDHPKSLSFAKTVDAVTLTLSDDTTNDDFKIDVTEGSVKFADSLVNDLDVILGKVKITNNTVFAGVGTETICKADGATQFYLNAGDDTVNATATLTIEGAFGASVGKGTEGLYLLNGGTKIFPDTLTLTTATFKIDNSSTTVLTAFVDNEFDIHMVVDGTSLISEFTPTAKLDLDYDTTTYADEGVSADLNEVVKNGSSAQKTFVLNDNDAYSCYVRITNPSGISGSVFITMYNDNGDPVTFDLNQVSAAGEVMTGGNLKAGASTPLIPIADLYAAAQAADSTFAVSGASKKLRFNAEAEFGSNALGDMTGIVVNVLAMARDGNSFFMLP